MSLLSLIIRKVLSGKADYCCLCFKGIKEEDTSYNVEDEVVLDTERAEGMNVILSTLLGHKVSKINNYLTLYSSSGISLWQSTAEHRLAFKIVTSYELARIILF